MLKVRFKTNIDFYDDSWFPKSFSAVPQIGSMVSVLEFAMAHIESRKMPLQLEVKSVYWEERGGDTHVYCDLHFNQTQVVALKLKGIDWEKVY